VTLAGSDAQGNTGLASNSSIAQDITAAEDIIAGSTCKPVKICGDR